MVLRTLVLAVLCLNHAIYCYKSPSVIIIGAGPAGIAAATKLLENNVTNITVLEAEGRIGGRVNSVVFGDAVVDLGAEWCHGANGNIVYELVKDLEVLGHSDFHFKLSASDREDVDDGFSYELHEIFDNIYSPDGHKEQVEGISVGDYFIKSFNSSVYNKYKNDSEKLDFSLSVLECFHHYVLGSEGAFSWFDTSANSDYKTCGGDLNLHWKGRGYKTALDVLMKKYPQEDLNFWMDDIVMLNKEVTKVIWDNNNINPSGASVICRDGSIHNADHVIFTPSLGVLKDKHRSLFKPALPDIKFQAIRDLGIGAVMKVMLHFPERWWPETNFTGFSFVWTPNHKEMLVVEFPDGPRRHGRSWLLELFGVYPVENNPNVLSAWFTGELVPEIEKTSNETILNGVMFVLNKFLGHKHVVTKPDKVIRTNWYTNPNFRGTYSFQTIESRKITPSANAVLAKPLINKSGAPTLLFAGEATHSYYYSTVHGAIETGYREADRILKYINNNNLY